MWLYTSGVTYIHSVKIIADIPGGFCSVVVKIQHSHEKSIVRSPFTTTTSFTSLSVVIKAYSIGFDIFWFSIEFYCVTSTKNFCRVRRVREKDLVKRAWTFNIMFCIILCFVIIVVKIWTYEHDVASHVINYYLPKLSITISPWSPVSNTKRIF